MMPPLPILLAFIVLIGYPLVQIAAIKLRRYKRLKFNALTAKFLAYEDLTDLERQQVTFLIQSSRGGIETKWRLLKVAPKLFVLPFASRVPRSTEVALTKREMEKQFQLKYLRHLAIQLEWATSPISIAIAAIPLSLIVTTGILAAMLTRAAKPMIPRLSDIESVMFPGVPQSREASFT